MQFDGDILNIIGIGNEELKYVFRKFNPVERMMMARDSGELNAYFTISKGQQINLYYFAICDKDIDPEAEKVLERWTTPSESKCKEAVPA